MTLDELIARTTQICVGRGVNPLDSPLLDAGLTLEALYPHALRYVVTRDLRSGGDPQNYMRTHTITLVAGVGDLPNTVLREYMDMSFLPSETYASYVPYPHFIRQRYDALLKYYSINIVGAKETLYYSDEIVNSVDLSVPSLPDVPANGTADLAITPKLGDDVIVTLAAAVMGDIKLSELLSYR